MTSSHGHRPGVRYRDVTWPRARRSASSSWCRSFLCSSCSPATTRVRCRTVTIRSNWRSRNASTRSSLDLHTPAFCSSQYVSNFNFVAHGRGAKYCDQLVCMSFLFVCLYVCPLAYLENHTSKFYQIFCTYYSGTVLLWPQRDTLCTSGFMDDVMFSHNAGNRRTQLFRAVRQVVARGRSLPFPTAACH